MRSRFRRPRVLAFAVVALLSAALLAGSALTAPPTGSATPSPGDAVSPPPNETTDPYPGHTLVTIQAEGWFGNNNGRAIVVSPDGDVVWEYDPPNARVFDAELLRSGNVLVSVAVATPAEECPGEYDGGDTCVHNRVVELEYDSTDVVWEHDWYDTFPNHHEVHDADRLPSGETAIADMGNHRLLTVSSDGEVTWEWNAKEHISEGTPFWDAYVPPGRADEFRQGGPASDWTHMNDVDRLENGNLLVSIRNFDVVLEVRRPDGQIAAVYGVPGDHDTMQRQHNPNVLEGHDTMLVADSENDRVIELDTATGETVWRYDGTGSGQPLAWPRDADRLPNGNTLIADSRNFRVLEINRSGDVVWSYSLSERRGIVYEADRVRLPGESGYIPEEPDDVPPGTELESRTTPDSTVGRAVATVDSWLGFVFPQWIGTVEVAVGLVGLGAVVGLGRELRGGGAEL